MKTLPKTVKNIFISVLILVLSFAVSLFFQQMFELEEHITTLFVFAVFLISLLTDGYVYGIISSLISMLAVNFAFTFPFFAFNFTIPVNLISACVMVTISVLTGTLTTKIKHTESVRAESERERMRANLLRAVSHDLRTPLTTVYGSACTLLDNRDELTAQQKESIINGIKEDSEWLIRMVENLLSITRIDSGSVEIIKTPTVLEELIDSVVLKFNKRYPNRTVLIDIPDDIVVIPMDAMLIEQVMVNLLENSVQHAKGMSELSIRVFTLGEKAVFEISDDGCGIAPDRLKTIFCGRYSSDDLPTDGGRKNSGIGLSVCATIIRAHGGDIGAENKKTGGMVFRFTLITDREEINP